MPSPLSSIIRFGGQAASQAVNPRNYNFLREAAENVLSRTVPKGVNFGAVPTQFLNTLTDIQRMAPGAAKEAARNTAKTTLTRAARAQSPAPRPVGQGPTGLLRAPSIGNVPTRVTSYQSTRPITTLAPRTNIPGSPLATDYALSRQTGMTQALGQARKASPVNAQNFLDQNLKSIFNPKNLAKGLGVGLLTEAGLSLADRAVPGGLPSEIRGAVEGAGWGSMFGPQGAIVGAVVGADLGNERGKGAGTLTGEFERGTLKLDPLEARRLYMDQVRGPVRSMDMDAPIPGLTTGTPLQPARGELPALTPLQERAYQSEASRLQQQASADPYFQQSELYRKAREQANKSGLPENREKIEQLGLAIHAAKFGDPTSRTTLNPLMEGLQRQPAPMPRDEEARIEAMDMAAEAVNQMLNPSVAAPAPPALADTIYSSANLTQAPGFNTSATFDLSSIGARITDMQPNLNTFVSDRSGQQGFAFDKNILDEKTRAAFMKQLGY